LKILYVEDELTKNIPKIIRLFSKYLGVKKVKELEVIENDKSGYGATPNEIKLLVESCGIVDVEFTFHSALNKINENNKQYSMFIIDRNLSEIEYELEDIQKVDPNFKDDFYDQFFEREGDYFLEKLISEQIDVNSKFYFLTANSRDDLRNTEKLKNHLDFGRFKKENIFDKSNTVEMEKLKVNIENNDMLILMKENIRFIKILESIGGKTKNKYIKLLKNKDKNDSISIFENLVLIRNIFENVISHLAKHLKDHNCWNPKNNTQLLMWPFIIWIRTKSKNNVSSVVNSSLSSIWSIASDFGDHDGDGKRKSNKGYQPTTDTVNFLISALKDIIVWFNSVSTTSNF
jgi:hypothetical protein